MVYDFLIIGGGCAGLSAAMYAARLNLSCVVLADLPGGLITTTHLVENWPGIVSTSGPDLAMQLLEHAKAFGVEIKSQRATNIIKNGEGDFIVETRKEKYQAKSVLIATGTKHRKMGVPGEEELANKGVSYCALCDGAFFRDKNIVVCGSGDSAAKEAVLLADYGKKVFLVSKYEDLKGEVPNVKAVHENEKIELVAPTKVKEIKGSEKVEGIILENGREIECSAVFVAIGHIALSSLAEGVGVELNDRKEIMINRNSQTNVDGVFAAGDVCDTGFKQAIIGSAEGVTAAYYAAEYVKGLNK